MIERVKISLKSNKRGQLENCQFTLFILAKSIARTFCDKGEADIKATRSPK